MNGPGSSVANREGQGKFAQHQVSTVEKYFGLLCETLGSVIRKSARLRDKGDLFSHQLKEYAETEKLNNSTRTSLLKFAENFSTVQDYRNTEVSRLEAKVLKPLMKYGELCKNMKGSVKGNQSAWDREKKQVARLEKLQQKQPASSPQVVKAQADLQRMRQETGVYGEQLIAEIDLFERNKLADIKSVLSEFVQIEMMFHAKALKYLSKCYQATQNIDADADMDQFRNALLEASGLARSFTQTGGSTGHSHTYASGTLSSSNTSMYHQSPRGRMQGPMYDDDDDDDEETDDDDDETDDEYES